jgi:predicted 3-demethylubiquinone-9 3-methyltransferase (glyoxalase superfamily)
MPKITTFLTYDHQAEEAANFYVSIFKKSKIGTITRFGEGAPAPAGSVMTVSFELDGQEFVALNGGPHFKFTEAFSLWVDCKTQQEIDDYWEKLSAGSDDPGQCGWIKDKFGVSWQIFPSFLIELINDPDPAKAKRAFDAMINMRMIDIAALKRAHDGG